MIESTLPPDTNLILLGLKNHGDNYKEVRTLINQLCNAYKRSDERNVKKFWRLTRKKALKLYTKEKVILMGVHINFLMTGMMLGATLDKINSWKSNHQC